MGNIVVNKDTSQNISFLRDSAVDALYFTVKKPSLPVGYLLQKTLADTTYDAEEGKYTIPLTVADLQNLNVGSYKFDIEIIKDGKKKTIAKGSFDVKSGAVSADGTVVKSNLEMTRGDSTSFRFQRINDAGEVIIGQPSSLLFEVPAIGIQKTLEDMTQDIDGTFHIPIDPEDTNGVAFGSYGFTLKVTEMGVLYTIAEGLLKITEEVTFPENEG